MSWHTPRGTRLQYCAKVGVAAFLGYLLCAGERSQYGVYSAFTAALIVGTSVGEDLATSRHRVLGTLAGMASGLAMVAAFGLSAASLAAGVALTAFIATGFGWGVPAARIGASVCAVIIAAHIANAFEYSLMRAANTLLGVVVGLAVSLVVLPVRGRDEIARGRRATLAAAAALLERMGAGGVAAADELSALRLALLNEALALEKAGKDTARERILKVDVAALVLQAREAQTVGLCAMAASLAHAELVGGSHSIARPAAAQLPPAVLAQADAAARQVALQLRSTMARIAPEFAPETTPDSTPLPFDELAARLLCELPADSPLRLTLQGYLHELREIQATLSRPRPAA